MHECRVSAQSLKRMDDLLGLPDRSRDPAEREEYKEIKLERIRAEAKINELESKILNLKDTLKKMDLEIESSVQTIFYGSSSFNVQRSMHMDGTAI